MFPIYFPKLRSAPLNGGCAHSNSWNNCVKMCLVLIIAALTCVWPVTLIMCRHINDIHIIAVLSTRFCPVRLKWPAALASYFWTMTNRKRTETYLPLSLVGRQSENSPTPGLTAGEISAYDRPDWAFLDHSCCQAIFINLISNLLSFY